MFWKNLAQELLIMLSKDLPSTSSKQRETIKQTIRQKLRGADLLITNSDWQQNRLDFDDQAKVTNVGFWFAADGTISAIKIEVDLRWLDDREIHYLQLTVEDGAKVSAIAKARAEVISNPVPQERITMHEPLTILHGNMVSFWVDVSYRSKNFESHKADSGSS